MHWKTSNPLLTRWSDEDDDIIETVRAQDEIYGEQPLFKLQTKAFSSAARIVVRNYVSSTQVTVIDADSIHYARLGYQELVNMILSPDDLANPETVRLALERRLKLPASRLQNLVNPDGDRFPDPMLRPFDHRWNPTEFEADIILVHGLGGDSRSTWTNTAGMWPIIWLLDAQVGIQSMLHQYNINDLPAANRIRVLTVSHRAAMFNIDIESDPQYIARRLVGLLFSVGVGSKPIIWLAHSLGGLIVKEILFATQNGSQRDIFNSTKGVVFFGTPHCGAPWASTLRQVNAMHDAPGLKYLDPAPAIGGEAGNATNLQVLNAFLSDTTIPFLNFSEGSMCSLPFLSLLAPLMRIIIVPDTQARIPGCVCTEPTSLAEQISLGTLPSRVHFTCLDCDHLNISRPSDRNHPTYRLTKTYVAHWLQRRTDVIDLGKRVNWEDFTRSIVDTVRMYSLVVDRITDEDRIRQLLNLSTAIAFVLRKLNINEFLIVLAFLSGAVVATGAAGAGAAVVIGGPIGAAVAVIGVVAAASLGAALVLRLGPRVRELLTNNSAVIRETVNLISAYVMPDFEEIPSNAQSEQELDATLNYLRRTAAQTICCVFLEPGQPDIILRDPRAIRAAVIKHGDRIRQAEVVVAHLSQAMNGTTTINSDEAEEEARAILTAAFIDQALHGTATHFHE
jgi:pimeloyl-ACP methyl ester carboxylesterase